VVVPGNPTLAVGSASKAGVNISPGQAFTHEFREIRGNAVIINSRTYATIAPELTYGTLRLPSISAGAASSPGL
jgi:hypothetical protein